MARHPKDFIRAPIKKIDRCHIFSPPPMLDWEREEHYIVNPLKCPGGQGRDCKAGSDGRSRFYGANKFNGDFGRGGQGKEREGKRAQKGKILCGLMELNRII